MKDFRWSRADDDLYVVDGIELMGEGESLAQKIELSIRLLKGTWFLDTRDGIDWLQVFEYNSKSMIDSVVRSAILDISEVASIVRYSSNLEGNALVIDVQVKAKENNELTLVRIEV